MKKLVAAAVVLVALLAVGCTGGNGVIGSTNLDLLNGNPGPPVAQPSSNTAHSGHGLLSRPRAGGAGWKHDSRDQAAAPPPAEHLPERRHVSRSELRHRHRLPGVPDGWHH